MQFRIIKLTNNDDPKEFTLEITRMRDIQFCPIQIIAFTPCLEDILILIMNASKREMNFMMCIIKKQ